MASAAPSARTKYSKGSKWSHAKPEPLSTDVDPTLRELTLTRRHVKTTAKATQASHDDVRPANNTAPAQSGNSSMSLQIYSLDCPGATTAENRDEWGKALLTNAWSKKLRLIRFCCAVPKLCRAVCHPQALSSERLRRTISNYALPIAEEQKFPIFHPVWWPFKPTNTYTMHTIQYYNPVVRARWHMMIAQRFLFLPCTVWK